jgi:hypothetical protein
MMNDQLLEKMIVKCLANYFGLGLHSLADQELRELKKKVREEIGTSDEGVFLIVEDVVYDYLKTV